MTHAQNLREYPLKFPSMSFYVESIRDSIAPDEEVYCLILTDGDAEQVSKEIKSQIEGVTFDIMPYLTTLEAFWLMARPNTWDIFIRPDSQYSGLPCLLSQVKKIITPEGH